MAASLRAPLFRNDSDADDEYERSEVMSPTLPTEFSVSPTESDGLSAEQTPTFARDITSPRGKVIDWSAEQSADFVAALGLEQYADKFVEEYITGDALVALVHTDLKDMGISSIGHRLTILKGIYDVKVKQNVSVEPDHYVPLSADSSAQDAPPTHDDISRIINIIKDRDDEIRSLREDLIRISEENRKLREDFLPLVKVAKDRSQPLPTPEEGPDLNAALSGGLSRKYSKKILLNNIGHGNKNPSPTIQESGLDPSAAALAASTHLTASMRDNGLGSPNQSQPSPTSPAYRDGPGSTGPTSRPFPNSDNPNLTLSTPSFSSTASTAVPSITTPPTSNPPASATTPNSSQPGGNVEIFKSFRVSIDDPCYKVLPVALKKYNISADWRQYALYIVYGDQERCLGLNEKPLILFKQLDREGRKPMFMLRKHAAPAEGHVTVVQNNQANAAALPGGVL